MKTKTMQRVLPAILFATICSAQEFELDLTEAKPQVTIPVEFRPSIGVLSVKAADTEETSASRARQLEAELLKQLSQSDTFQTVVEPAAARAKLGNEFVRADACLDFSCMDATAKLLKVDRLVRLTVQKQGAGSLVTMYGFDPAFNEVLIVAQESGEKAEKLFMGMSGKSQAQKDREFLKKMESYLNQVQKTLSVANGKIVVDNAEPSAIVTVDGVEVGMGSVETIVQRGSHTVKVIAAEFKPFSQAVAVEPAKQVEVKVSLEAKPLDSVLLVKPVAEKKGGIFTRPGLYVALVGAAAAATGVYFGLAAQKVKTKLAHGGDPVEVTRAEAKAAPTQALLANILIGAGAAAVAGGVVWIIVTPTGGSSKPLPKTGVGDPVDVISPGGVMMHVGGVF